MNIIKISLIIVLTNFKVFSQGIFKLTGEIKNPTERKVLITLYRDWVGEEEEYELVLDNKNEFSFNVDLTKIAYLDFYYAEVGFHFWAIEPKDQINIKFDAKDFWHTLNSSGIGYEKWLYYNQAYHRFEEKGDFEKDLDNWRKLSMTDFSKKLDAEQARQLEFLKESKGLSPEFIDLRKADIVGSIQNHKIEHLSSEKYALWSESQVKKHLNFDSVSTKAQDLSLEYGSSFQNLIELFSSKIAENKKKELSERETFNLIQSFYTRNLVSKELGERLLATYLKNAIDLGGLNENLQELVAEFDGFAENRDYKNYLAQKVGFVKTLAKGSPAKPFYLKDLDGNEVSLNTLRGKIIYLDFWASWCGPCIYDMKFMENVKVYFKDRDDIVFVYVSLDNEEEWRESVKQYEVKGINLRTDERGEITKNYGVNGIPAYFLIDKNGNFAVSQVADPSMDEGKTLIKQIEEVLK